MVVAVNIGNPHCVFFGKNINDIDLNNIGPSIENHELFPNKTNVEIIEIINKRKIKMRVWERGVGSNSSLWKWSLCFCLCWSIKKYT